MGLLDKNITITFLEGKVPLQDLFEVIKEKLGDKYKVEFIKKGKCCRSVFGNFRLRRPYLRSQKRLPPHFYYRKACSYDRGHVSRGHLLRL